jgi:hypothetical protein
MPNGLVPSNRVANNGSLASPEIIGYGKALLRDLCARYPDVGAIRVDWPEYPPYSIDDMFVDFSSHAEIAAERLGFDFERMREQTSRLYDLLHGGLAAWLRRQNISGSGDPAQLLQWACDFPGVLDLLRFKRLLAEELLVGFREVVEERSDGSVLLAANLFPWPWSLVSGANYERLGRHCSELIIKLYGMHWKMMFRFYCDQLIDSNPDVAPEKIVQSLLSILDFMDSPCSANAKDYAYPSPNEPYGVSDEAQRRKIEMACQAAPETIVRALVHGYGPAADFRQRLAVGRESSRAGIWINRYGYLSNEKLAIVSDSK